MNQPHYWLALLSALSPPLFASDVAEYGCGVMVNTGGELTTVAAPGLRVLDYSKDLHLAGFELDGAGKVTAVVCSRSSPVPAANDYQVLVAGVPFFIHTRNRTLVLEFSKGAYALRLVAGPPLTPREQSQVADRLRSFPLRRTHQAAPPNNSSKPTPLRGAA